MKRALVVTVAIAAALLAGCASDPSAVAAANNDRYDYHTVNAINRVAQARGLQVIWVNYPMRQETVPLESPSGT